MTNPYRQIKEIAEKHGMDLEELIHGLMASTYMDCCTQCNEKLQSDDFLQAFNRIAEELEFCRDFFPPKAA